MKQTLKTLVYEAQNREAKAE